MAFLFVVLPLPTFYLFFFPSPLSAGGNSLSAALPLTHCSVCRSSLFSFSLIRILSRIVLCTVSSSRVSLSVEPLSERLYPCNSYYLVSLLKNIYFNLLKVSSFKIRNMAHHVKDLVSGAIIFLVLIL